MPRAVAQVPIFLLAMVFSNIRALEPALNTSVGCFTVNEIVQWILCTPVQARPTPLAPSACGCKHACVSLAHASWVTSSAAGTSTSHTWFAQGAELRGRRSL